MAARTRRAEQVEGTREAILSAAERLFAEHGVYAVSNRQVGEAAGQGNNFAVGYHFGTKTDLVRAIVRRHAEPMEAVRVRMLAEIGDSDEVRDWVACLVRPFTEHLAELGGPTWYARFGAQVMTDPGLRRIIVEEALSTTPIQQVIDGLNRCLPELPLPVHLERGAMARYLMSHTCAERERALAEGTLTVRNTWEDAATGLIDAITGMWMAPVTSDRRVIDE
ncbi:AcrR family transcriptional regulator [Actinoalloteichus hoggarensis]|uniref:DNA-binding transcriptional repressor AcrR n=1 Tax=Actinoalloteichus hoggarensis TaxID=1470176 RepID=A0A221W4C2_9PSEU|nr:TetR family transcriptional regulator [Actinoalloteichus hoggarensis]ASO20740.1 DNA-binding transcriptional repressor AcrR [Actinoalloteichus hoggarensis]MBB5920670.1 AcrR family transcriptional regulator [Actinoalloteichus hoggarensis]